MIRSFFCVIAVACLFIFSGCASNPYNVGQNDPYFGTPTIRISDAKVADGKLVLALELDREPGDFLAKISSYGQKEFKPAKFVAIKVADNCYVLSMDIPEVGQPQTYFVCGAQSAANGAPASEQFMVRGNDAYVWDSKTQNWRLFNA